MSIHVTGSEELLVNTFTTGAQSTPTVTALDGGGWIATWVSATQDKDSSGVYQQRFDINGNPIGDEIRVNTTTPSDQSEVSVEALDDGGWMVVWKSFGQDGAEGGIYRQRYSAAGTAVGNEERVNTTTASAQTAPDVTQLSDGGWLVTWQSFNQDGSSHGIYQQRYEADGDAFGGETLVNSTTVGNQTSSATVGLADGGWIVTWVSDNQDVFQQRFGADGQPTGEETRVNATLTGQRYDPSIATLKDGGWVVTWSSDGQDGDLMGIYQQRYDKNGAAVGGETLVNTTVANDQDKSTVDGLPDGGWLVTWESYGQDGSDQGIFQQRYDKAGNAIGGEVQVNLTTDGQQKNASVTVFDDGSWIVSWQSDNQDGSGFGIYQRHFSPDVEGTKAGETLFGTGWSETLRGLGGNDTLNGGFGADIMIGGKGNDRYIVDDAGDQVVEAADEGSDLVSSSLSFSLKSLGAVEKLTLEGGAALNATGNKGANLLTGNLGANRLDGLAGDDVLTGGRGADTFLFRTGGDRDTITDFQARGAAHDILDLGRLKSVRDFADLSANHFEQHGSDVWIDAGHGDLVVLQDVRLRDLKESDFLF